MKALRKITAFAAAIQVFASWAFAAEVAFYPFAEGNDGANALGVALHNAVDASALGGSAIRNSGETAAHFTKTGKHRIHIM